MDKLSRVQKYAQLRENIENDHSNDENIFHDEQIETLKKIHPNYQKKDNFVHKPKHEQINSGFDEEENSVYRYQEEEDDSTSQFTNEYLDDFLNEVKDYNLKKGNRRVDNTQADILRQLNQKTHQRRVEYLAKINDEDKEIDFNDEDEIYTSTLSKEEIAQEIKNLAQVSENITLEPKKIAQTKMHEPLVEKKMDTSTAIKPKSLEVTDTFNMQEIADKMIERTQQLYREVEVYQNDVKIMEKKISKANVALNTILVILILSLLIIIGIIAFMIVNNGVSM